MSRQRLGPQKRTIMERVLKENGLQPKPKRGKGSHIVWVHPSDAKRRTTVPHNSVIDMTLAATIIEQAGKTREEYLSHV